MNIDLLQFALTIFVYLHLSKHYELQFGNDIFLEKNTEISVVFTLKFICKILNTMYF